MRRLIRALRAGALAAVPLALGPLPVGAQAPATDAGRRATSDRAGARTAASPRVIGTHHIDRYAAIERLQQTVRENPRSLSDWIILGELAHEVGVDAPPGQSTTFFKLSRQAYEKALELAPDKPGLKAAAQFARDYEEGSERFAGIRDRATQTYLEARRRDLAATQYVPTIRVAPQVPMMSANTMGADLPAVARAAASPSAGPVGGTTAGAAATTTGSTGANTAGAGGATGTGAGGANAADAAKVATAGVPGAVPGAVPLPGAVAPADPAPAVSPAPPDTASTEIANFGVRQIYSSTPLYMPFYTPQGRPLTYQQYSSTYYPSGGLDTDAGQLPVTLQRYAQQQRMDASERPVDPSSTVPRSSVPPEQRPIR